MANVKLLTFQGGVSQNFRLQPQILRTLKNPADFGLFYAQRLSMRLQKESDNLIGFIAFDIFFSITLNLLYNC